jgi:hypothetical protein
MNFTLAELIFLFLLSSCVNKTNTVSTDEGKIEANSPKSSIEDTEDSLRLDTVNYNQVLLNSLPLQIDTLTAINRLGAPSSREIYAFGTCYPFGDAKLWDFKGCRYYVHKDSLYFHELYFDPGSKTKNFSLQLPKLEVSGDTKLTEFQKVYKTSFANSNQRLPNAIIFRTGKPLNCQLRFEYKDGKLWRVAMGM